VTPLAHEDEAEHDVAVCDCMDCENRRRSEDSHAEHAPICCDCGATLPKLLCSQCERAIDQDCVAALTAKIDELRQENAALVTHAGLVQVECDRLRDAIVHVEELCGDGDDDGMYVRVGRVRVALRAALRGEP